MTDDIRDFNTAELERDEHGNLRPKKRKHEDPSCDPAPQPPYPDTGH